jgi:hypothetical protein
MLNLHVLIYGQNACFFAEKKVFVLLWPLIDSNDAKLSHFQLKNLILMGDSYQDHVESGFTGGKIALK